MHKLWFKSKLRLSFKLLFYWVKHHKRTAANRQLIVYVFIILPCHILVCTSIFKLVSHVFKFSRQPNFNAKTCVIRLLATMQLQTDRISILHASSYLTRWHLHALRTHNIAENAVRALLLATTLNSSSTRNDPSNEIVPHLTWRHARLIRPRRFYRFNTSPLPKYFRIDSALN